MVDLNELIQGKKPSVLTSDEFVHLIETYVDICYSGGRMGQSYMAAMFKVRPDIHKEVDKCDYRDCFYDDEKITNLINYLNGRPWKS
jgi:hypothetical protein